MGWITRIRRRKDVGGQGLELEDAMGIEGDKEREVKYLCNFLL
jgi:hypothetical protein